MPTSLSFSCLSLSWLGRRRRRRSNIGFGYSSSWMAFSFFFVQLWTNFGRTKWKVSSQQSRMASAKVCPYHLSTLVFFSFRIFLTFRSLFSLRSSCSSIRTNDDRKKKEKEEEEEGAFLGRARLCFINILSVTHQQRQQQPQPRPQLQRRRRRQQQQQAKVNQREEEEEKEERRKKTFDLSLGQKKRRFFFSLFVLLRLWLSFLVVV